MNAHLTDTDMRALTEQGAAWSEIRSIAGEAARVAGMTLARVTGPDRSAQVVRVRDVIAYRAHANGHSYSEISRALGRDQSTIKASIRREKSRRQEWTK
ncbi:hypothetical protein PAF17_15965 [Paracoccus sp. Z330]|uniref:Chromosomal replication initiator DnaA C-terminal domain-containing protein n=1 Tax=Paracoccus onchidii TaxID=3017813 RepID=A0ABT4ZJ21_9RHOB|nr:helix-turn-helix domain-containing protein [Paracoccus onchidii]MDB6178988.1 hypothetical protein [Paracoccus onchidii]